MRSSSYFVLVRPRGGAGSCAVSGVLGHDRWQWGRGAEDAWEARCRAEAWRGRTALGSAGLGRIVDGSPGDCQARTDLSHLTGFSFCVKISFQAGQHISECHFPSGHK